MANESWMFVVVTIYVKLVIKYFSVFVENYFHGNIIKFLHKFHVVDTHTHTRTHAHGLSDFQNAQQRILNSLIAGSTSVAHTY